MLGMRKLVRILAVAAVTLASMAVASAADAAKPTTFREVQVVSGSADYLVYQSQVRRNHGDGSVTSTSTLFYVGRHGKPHKLAVGTYWTDISVYQAGPMVLFLTGTGAWSDLTWQWRNLDTGASGSFPAAVQLPGTPPRGWATTGRVVAATPTGWVVERQAITSADLNPPSDGPWLQTPDGTLTPFAAPPTATTPDRPSASLMAWDGGAREGQTQSAYLMPLSAPGTYVPLGKPGELMHCRSTTTTRVACATYSAAPERYRGIRVFDAAGRLVRSERNRCALDSYNDAAAPFALLGKGLAWVTVNRRGAVWGSKAQHCDPHRLVVRTAAGRLVHEPGRYVSEPIAALGGVVVGNDAAGPATSTKLVLFTSAHHHRTIASAR